MKESQTSAERLYETINAKTQQLGGNLLPSEVLLGAMVDVMRSADFAQAEDGTKAILFNDATAMAFQQVLKQMEVVAESDRFQEFARLIRETVESSPELKADYENLRRTMLGKDNGDNENKSIGFNR